MATLPTPTSLTPAPQQVINADMPFSLPPGPPQFDVVETLPPAAADKLRALRQRRDDAHKLSVPYEDIRQASMSRVEAENALKRLTSHTQDGGFNLPPDDRRVIEAQKRLDKATDDFERLKQLQEVRTAAWQAASAALSNVEVWLRDGKPHGTVLEVVEVVEPSLAKGETVIDGIERLRRRGRELKAALHTIQSSCFPSSYCKQRMREQIEQLAMQGAPSVSRLVELDGPVDFQTQRVQSEVLSEQRALAFHQATDVLGLVAWMHKPALIAALDAEIDSESDDKAALSHEARQRREAEVMGDLLAVERDEAALVWSAQSQSLPVEHRSDCAPLAILQCRLITAPHATNGHTTMGYSFDLAGGRP